MRVGFMRETHVSVSEGGTMGSAIEKTNTGISVPDDPIINYIEVDALGKEIRALANREA